MHSASAHKPLDKSEPPVPNIQFTLPFSYLPQTYNSSPEVVCICCLSLGAAGVSLLACQTSSNKKSIFGAMSSVPFSEERGV